MSEEEDTVQYWLYPDQEQDTCEASSASSLAQVFSLVDTWTRGYIWTRDKFSLRVDSLPGGGWCLTGGHKNIYKIAILRVVSNFRQDLLWRKCAG